MKKTMLSSFLFLSLLILNSCSSDDPTEAPSKGSNTIIKKTNLISSESISETEFVKPYETIVYNDKLYVVDDLKTYSYDFNTKEWLTVNERNTDNFKTVADYPYFDYNVSFIRENKWYLLSFESLYVFDFSTNTWTKEASFYGNYSKILAPIGIYYNNRLFVFSDVWGGVYEYDFETKDLIEYSNFGQKNNSGQLVKSVFKVNDEYYYTKITYYNSIKIYKFVDNFKNIELVNELNTDYIAQGSGFIFENKIIFGLGGEISSDGTNITRYELNDKFYYYDTVENTFGGIENNLYEGRYLALPIQHNNKYYLLGGVTVKNNVKIYRKTLDELKFQTIEQ